MAPTCSALPRLERPEPSTSASASASISPSATTPTHRLRWRVFKLGGTSMASASVVREAATHLVTEAGARPVAVVVSALAGTTDRLLALAGSTADRDAGVSELRRRHEALLEAVAPTASRAELNDSLGELSRRLGEIEAGDIEAEPENRVATLVTGERLAATILAATCRLLAGPGIAIEIVDPGDLLVADGAFEDAEADLPASRTRARSDASRFEPRPGRLWIVPGFYARGLDRRLRLFGRGGSDTSATLLGAVLEADQVEIWTDVDGVYPRDPRRVAGQAPFERLSYEHAERLALAGARVLHEKSMAPARSAGVPVLVRNSFRPQAPGTWIGPADEEASS